MDEELEKLHDSNAPSLHSIGFVNKLVSDAEYNKKLMEERLDKLKGVDREALRAEIVQDSDDETEIKMETESEVIEENNKPELDVQSSSSEDEFPPELLKKSLSEIKEIKKRKKNKAMKNKSES